MLYIVLDDKPTAVTPAPAAVEVGLDNPLYSMVGASLLLYNTCDTDRVVDCKHP